MKIDANIFIRSLIAALIISSLIFGSILVLIKLDQIESLEMIAYDWFIRLKSQSSKDEPRVCIATVTEDDIRNLGFWLLTDDKMAEAIEKIIESEPIAVGVDIFRDVAVPPGTERLASVLSDNRNIFGAMKFGKDGVPPHPVLKREGRFGFNDMIVDRDGTVRRGLLFLDDGANLFYSFGLVLALSYLQERGVVPVPDPVVPHYIKIGPTTVRPFEKNDGCYVEADSRGYQFLLDFQDCPNSLENFSLTALYEGKVDREKIKGKIVLIGVSAESVKDIFYTPVNRDSLGNRNIAGVVLHAHIINQILRFGLGKSKPIENLTQKEEYGWIWIWAFAGTVIGLSIRSPWYFSGVSLAALSGLVLAAHFSFFYQNVWIPLISPGLAFALSSVLIMAYVSNHEKKQRTTLMDLFSRHVSHEVAETIWHQRKEFINNGRPRSRELTVTIMFSDLKGFTTVAEGMNPQDLIDWLNTYMESMVKEIIKHKGVVDDYAGDGIKANFGFPIARENETEIRRDAINAVNCALAMEKELERLNIQRKKQNLPEFGVRIGIHTGKAVAGALGGTERLKYTTLGDNVNIAARLESYHKEFAKERSCRILISDKTLRYLNGQFEVEKIGEANLKGKSLKVSIFQILGHKTGKLKTNGGQSHEAE